LLNIISENYWYFHMKQANNSRNSRGRGSQRKPGKQNNSGNNRNDNKVRGNPKQLLEKYKTQAREATQAGDRIAAENFFQYADHYQRVLNDMRGNQQNRNNDKNRGGGEEAGQKADNSGDERDTSNDPRNDDRGDGKQERRGRRRGRGPKNTEETVAVEASDSEVAETPEEAAAPSEPAVDATPELPLEASEEPVKKPRRGRKKKVVEEETAEAPADDGEAAA
jgi:hypothetical protein